MPVIRRHPRNPLSMCHPRNSTVALPQFQTSLLSRHTKTQVRFSLSNETATSTPLQPGRLRSRFVERRIVPLANPGDPSSARTFLFATTSPRVLLTNAIPRDPPQAIEWQHSPERMERQGQNRMLERQVLRQSAIGGRSGSAVCDWSPPFARLQAVAGQSLG